jgi:hypothetical protein
LLDCEDSTLSALTGNSASMFCQLVGEQMASLICDALGDETSLCSVGRSSSAPMNRKSFADQKF